MKKFCCEGVEVEEADNVGGDAGASPVAAAAPAVAQVSQETGNESESGDVEINASITSNGNSANQCGPFLQGSQTGNLQNAEGNTQYRSTSDDIEDEGSTFTLSPSESVQYTQRIQQSSAASSQPTPPSPSPSSKAASPSPKAAPSPPPKMEEKKELPKTGGTGSASLLGLVAGALLVGGGLLVRRLAR